MTDPNSTIRKLAEITDAALFERLATAVLRLNDAHLYGNLSHPGVNSDGKTVKAPLDGIGWSRNGGDRVIAAAHSTCAQKDIFKKWLHDPSTVRPRKSNNKSTPLEGDLRKVIREIGTFRTSHPSLRATVALTSNREPDQECVVAAQKLATDAAIDLEIWPATRIAQFLDSPEGQWTRKIHLGDAVEFVSTDLLRSCTKRRLEEYAHLLNSSELVDRNSLEGHVPGHMLLVGPSGVGKTTIALQTLSRHADEGGTGLVIPHETVMHSPSLAEAIDIELRKLEPDLQPNAGQLALVFTTENFPFVVVIEDANASSDPPMILNRVIGWVLSGKANPMHQWQLICPIWPRYIDSIKQQLKDTHESMLHAVNVYTDEQAAEAVRKRAQSAGKELLPGTISSIAKSLGNDPLLIALSDFTNSLDAAMVVGDYVARELEIVASRSDNLHQSDVVDAVDHLVRRMLLARKLNPSLREIRVWLQAHEQVQTLSLVFKAGSVLRLVPRDREDILTPRHDRVLLSLFSRVMSEDLRKGSFDNVYLSDPFFSEAVGAAILRVPFDKKIFDWLMHANPLSFFHAFHLATKTHSQLLANIVQILREWLSDVESHCNKFRSVRFRALQILADTDAPQVLTITDLFPKNDQHWDWWQARFRNGDIGPGLTLLTAYGSIGVTIPGRPELLAHIFARFGPKIIAPLKKLLSTQDLDSRNRMGCLYLAGYLGDSALSTAILASWACENPSNRNLLAYLWAAARCHGNDGEKTLAMICDSWAELPEKNDVDGSGLSRNSLAADNLSWEFHNYLPVEAIPYFVHRASTDDRLNWAITYMMRDFDHPISVEHIARFLADRERNRQPGTFDISHNALLDGWERQQREHGIRMSANSKRRLLELAVDSANDLPLKKSAFRVWQASKSPADLDAIRQIDKTDDLYEMAIWARALREDKAVIPQLIELIPISPHYWWQAGRYLWSDEMTVALHRNIANVAENLKANPTEETDVEWILSERLMEIDRGSAERILLQEWDGLKYSPRFVQVALYLANPLLVQMAKEVISRAATPANFLKHICSRMGCRTDGRTGITRLEQVKLICEYADLLPEHDIYDLWEICNEFGWIDYRKTQLDEMLAKTEHYANRLEKSIDFADLDLALGGTVIGATSFWIDGNIRDGKKLPELMDGLFDWLEKHRTLKALAIVANIFQNSARRSDLERLQRLTESWSEATELMEDLAFTVMYRTLD
jgi:hypothetical protein